MTPDYRRCSWCWGYHSISGTCSGTNIGTMTVTTGDVWASATRYYVPPSNRSERRKKAKTKIEPWYRRHA